MLMSSRLSLGSTKLDNYGHRWRKHGGGEGSKERQRGRQRDAEIEEMLEEEDA